MIEISVLGPLEVRAPGRGVVSIPSPLQRALLVRLIIEPGRVVSVDRLVEDLWGEQPPGDPANALRYHVWQLRDALDPDRPTRSEGRYLRTKSPGYRFDPGDAWIDVAEFDRLRAAGRGLVGSDPERAASLLGEALALWRADALADVADHEFARAEARLLEERRLLTIEDRIAAELACGAADELVPELEVLVAQHPWRERLRGQLMVALYRSGRQAESLAAYREARELLGEELGIEPTAELRTIEEQIVLQDAALVSQRSTPSRSVSLPKTLTSFVGREAEIDQLRDLMAGHRVVTVVGPPGVGKTRLAIETVRGQVDRHPGGVWLVDLAPSEPGSDVAELIGDVLGLSAGHVGPQLSGEERPPAIASVVEYFRRRKALVVLDNCERLVDPVASTVRQIVASCPSVTVLLTSRRLIRVDGERAIELQPLAVADERDVDAGGWVGLLRSPAGRLFVDRSEAAGATWQRSDAEANSVATLCRRLDGLPLALELVAARTRSMSPADMLDHLDERFRLASIPGDDLRTTSLQAALQSSRDLLHETEARAFDALSVFSGDFDLSAAEVVLDRVLGGEEPGFELVGRLVDHSLVGVVGESPRRFRMLESVREFAGDELRSSRHEDAALSAHVDYYSELVEDAWALQPDSHEQLDRLARLDVDHQEILTAIERLRGAGEMCGAQRMAGAMGWYWGARSLQQRGLKLCDAIGETCPSQDPATLARFLWTWSEMHALMGNPETTARLAERAHRVAFDAEQWSLAAGALLNVVGVATRGTGTARRPNHERWESVFSLYQRAQDTRGGASAYARRARAAAWDGRYREALEDYQRAMAQYEDVDDDDGVAWARCGLADSLRLLGDLDGARRHIERASVPARRARSSSLLAWYSIVDAEIARSEGDLDRALDDYTRTLSYLEERSPASIITNSYRCMVGWVLRERGQHRDALEVMLEAVDFCLRSRTEEQWEHGLFVLESVAGLCAEVFESSMATRLYGAAAAGRTEMEVPMPRWDVARYERDVALARDRLDPEEFDRYWQIGSELTPEAAARLAVSELTPLLAADRVASS